MKYIVKIFIGAYYSEKLISKIIARQVLPVCSFLCFVLIKLFNLKNDKAKTYEYIYNEEKKITKQVLDADYGGFLKNKASSNLLFLIFIILIDIVVVVKRIFRYSFINYYISWKTAMPVLYVLLAIAWLIFTLLERRIKIHLKKNRRMYKGIDMKNACFVYFCIYGLALFVLLYLLLGKAFFAHFINKWFY